MRAARLEFTALELLAVGEDKEWDDFKYRATVKTLLRFALVRPVKGEWSGLTMHSMVRWRAGQEGDEMAYWLWYVVFSTAVCLQKSVEADRVRFQRRIMLHLPETARPHEMRLETSESNVSWMWTTIGETWHSEGRWTGSERLFLAAFRMRSSVLGEDHPDTLRAIADLAATYWNQGRRREAEELEVKVDGGKVKTSRRGAS